MTMMIQREKISHFRVRFEMEAQANSEIAYWDMVWSLFLLVLTLNSPHLPR